jgi:hypothetical protein
MDKTLLYGWNALLLLDLFLDLRDLVMGAHLRQPATSAPPLPSERARVLFCAVVRRTL